ncbi:MAG: right-handed parallel beta-helix repeat-containing protein [candidate division WOR-3 bacterium]|nr:right-handed parallel beta-helix repeat-containing protein [candidate division WOR-3 bacterium]
MLILLLLLSDFMVVVPEMNLDSIFISAKNMDTIFIENGIYKAQAEPYIEKICGNCIEPLTEVKTTVGFHIKNKTLVIIGENRDSTILITNAGYGVLFENCKTVYLSNLTITGGKRSPDGNATDAGIVVKMSKVIIHNVAVVNNTHRIDTVVVGIGGIFGREGAEIYIKDCYIYNNTWDGVALYRGASAVIEDNIIKKGRGAGIGITWDANALVFRNSISEYWKGIGCFGNSSAVVKNNAVFDNLGWGIIATGSSYMKVINNVIYHNGNCGFAVWDSNATGIFKNNIVAKNGWKEEWVCPCVGVWMNGILKNFPVQFNNFWDNKAGNYQGMEDQTGINGNISLDPLFDKENFVLKKDSPCINAGDTLIIDLDGSRSDMGIYGGPMAKKRE